MTFLVVLQRINDRPDGRSRTGEAKWDLLMLPMELYMRKEDMIEVTAKILASKSASLSVAAKPSVSTKMALVKSGV